MYQITIEDMLKAGVHFGHPTSKWNPNFKPFIAMKKNGIHIIDLNKTMSQLEIASREISKIVRDGGNILFVGTKKQAVDIIQEGADRCGMFYIVERWLGGTLTNFMTIKKSIKRLLMLEKESSEIYNNLTKKELNLLEREKFRLADLHRGIKDMKQLPAALFFVDAIHESTAIKEGKRLGIPIFGMVDSNSNPKEIDFPIPANDDSIRSIQIVVNYIVDTIIEARGGVVEGSVESTEKTAPAVKEEVVVAAEPEESEKVDTTEKNETVVEQELTETEQATTEKTETE
ncbi:MAG: 30S ribosomal protein S2 [FCB group bacterium]|nr:30S ribosomal protein S2 [FCB group bacterium]